MDCCKVRDSTWRQRSRFPLSLGALRALPICGRRVSLNPHLQLKLPACFCARSRLLSEAQIGSVLTSRGQAYVRFRGVLGLGPSGMQCDRLCWSSSW